MQTDLEIPPEIRAKLKAEGFRGWGPILAVKYINWRTRVNREAAVRRAKAYKRWRESQTEMQVKMSRAAERLREEA